MLVLLQRLGKPTNHQMFREGPLNLSGPFVCMQLALPQESSTPQATAPPPDVRRRLCPAVEVLLMLLGYALGAAFGPINPKAKPCPRA